MTASCSVPLKSRIWVIFGDFGAFWVFLGLCVLFGVLQFINLLAHSCCDFILQHSLCLFEGASTNKVHLFLTTRTCIVVIDRVQKLCVYVCLSLLPEMNMIFKQKMILRKIDFDSKILIFVLGYIYSCYSLVLFLLLLFFIFLRLHSFV